MIIRSCDHECMVIQAGVFHATVLLLHLQSEWRGSYLTRWYSTLIYNGLGELICRVHCLFRFLPQLWHWLLALHYPKWCGRSCRLGRTSRSISHVLCVHRVASHDVRGVCCPKGRSNREYVGKSQDRDGSQLTALGWDSGPYVSISSSCQAGSGHWPSVSWRCHHVVSHVCPQGGARDDVLTV